MNDDFVSEKVTIGLPKTLYDTLNREALKQRLSLSYCIRKHIMQAVEDDKKMVKKHYALLYWLAEVLYYTRLDARHTHPKWIVEANADVNTLVKKWLEEE